MVTNLRKTTNEARQYFKDCQIEYSEITRKDIDKLIQLIKEQLKEHKHFPMRLSKIVHFKSENGIFLSCYLYVNGRYFKKRQAISFEEEDWIGFAGWADSGNVQPFINAFAIWCDYITKLTANKRKS